MSYNNIVEYKIIPVETFKIIRGCARCGCKQIFSCKDHFRVNANGNLLDVWLIYGCIKCGYTYNLPIYERISSDKIPKQEYDMLLSNDKKKIFETGTNKSIFIKNKAEIVWDLNLYEVVPITENKFELEKDVILIRLYNTYDIPIRKDKIVAGILQVTRSKAKKLLYKGYVSVSLERNR